MVGHILASHYAINCLHPRSAIDCPCALVIKPGRAQVFARRGLYANTFGKEQLVVNGDILLIVRAQSMRC